VLGASYEAGTARRLTELRFLGRREGRQSEHKRVRKSQAHDHQNRPLGVCNSLCTPSRVHLRRASPCRVTAANTADTVCRIPQTSYEHGAEAFTTLRSLSHTLSSHGINAAYAPLDATFTTILLIGDVVRQSSMRACGGESALDGFQHRGASGYRWRQCHRRQHTFSIRSF
jgi:hypothetical protein